MQRMDKWTKKMEFVGMVISGISIALMMLLIMADVVMRNFLDSPITGTYELVQYFLMPLAVFPALAYTYTSGVLPRLGELVSKLPGKFQVFNKNMIIVIEIIIFVLLTLYGLKFAQAGIADRMAIPVSGNLIPVYPVYVVVPLGFLSVLWVIILETVKGFVGKKQAA